MRILHLDSGREMRGGQWQVLSLHRGLIDDGYDSVLLAPEGSPLLEAAGRADLPHDILRPLRLGLLSRQFDLIHAHDARSHTFAALFSRVPFVVSRRVAFPMQRSAASRWKYSRAGLFLAVSRHVGMQLRNAGVEERRIEVVYDGKLRCRPRLRTVTRFWSPTRLIHRREWLWPRTPRGAQA